jgi:hypothetical protein
MFLVVSVSLLDLPCVCALIMAVPGIEASFTGAETSWLQDSDSF